MPDETVPVWQHHGLVNVQMEDGGRKQVCTCEVADDEAVIIDGLVEKVGEKDDDCPHREGRRHSNATLTVDGEHIADIAKTEINIDGRGF